ncbi:hypothetical protein RJT34_03176 [Clitoria ternatea]|uniref:Myb-like domain-containing protein n=1 Tax=Clitoria ternatea TaxID=43366 RepID=A0AAN9KMH4_CLITE
MEFLDENAKPRFVFQSGTVASTEPKSNQKPTKPFLFVTVSLSSILFTFSLFFFQSEPLKSLLFWLSLSLLLGPFAPPSLTGGDVSVGRGHVVEFPSPEPEPDDDANNKTQRRSKPRRSEEVAAVGPVVAVVNGGASEKRRSGGGAENRVAVVEEKEWSEEDVEMLKKQMTKNPVGKPGRWEAIAAAFGGRHGVENVIKKVKELGEKRADDSDSYAMFLKKRKALDKRVVENGEGEGEVVESGWSSAEDVALLNALKAFPKDVSMRWEKVAAAVPGKSKAACMKRFAGLKKGFRSAKAAADG